MLKASALYIVIVIALVISVLCSAVIVAAYYYREVYGRNLRYDQLRNDLSSGINLLLTTDEFRLEQKISLYHDDNDSVLVKKNEWGIYTAASVCAYRQQDTLSRSFLIANEPDKQKWAVLYIIDEDRSISVSGDTHIRGTAFIPKAGVREAYVDNKAYSGDRKLIIGAKKDSEKSLPELKTDQLKRSIGSWWSKQKVAEPTTLPDTLTASFLSPTRFFFIKKSAPLLQKVKLKGNIVIRSDTTLTIDSSAHLENVLIFAKGIVVRSGFRGNCQLFASDSIYVERDCHFDYPSCLATVNFEQQDKGITKLSIEEKCTINGTVFLYNSNKDQLPPVISLGKEVRVNGQIYVAGLLHLKDKVSVFGSVFTNRFLYKSTYTTYENYLINLDLDADRLSPYYLTSPILAVSSKQQKVLQWLP